MKCVCYQQFNTVVTIEQTLKQLDGVNTHANSNCPSHTILIVQLMLNSL